MSIRAPTLEEYQHFTVVVETTRQSIYLFIIIIIIIIFTRSTNDEIALKGWQRKTALNQKHI